MKKFEKETTPSSAVKSETQASPKSNPSKSVVVPVGPSVDANHQPVSGNDNSANLFEDHIREQKKDAK